MLNWTFNRSATTADASAPGGPSLSQPQEPPPETQPSKSRIALALGGGAARGWAHIGVLRALDEDGIDVGMIAGTSIGALVGGCYLAGKLDELEAFARSLTMRRIAGLLDFAIGGGGLLGGLRLTKRMQEHLLETNIEDLDRTFVAVATEINSGHEVWIGEGPLITAIRASYALPGIFEPVKCNNRTLVDGALVNPVPVSVCRAHEEQLVVAVNLHYDLYGRSAVIKHRATSPVVEPQINTPIDTATKLGMTSVMVQAFNIIQDRISRARLAGDPPDLQLHPKLSDIGLSEFHRAGEAIDRGYHETKAKLGELKRLQDVMIR
ncbi:NTE family protein [Pararhizobium capsulatum DSM 1112]|uniref:NTE family protein n=1 Tax=Pararhizobium capsulatum DSM 1112 TaxID=1121113 RepID=A0ABU0BP90_9HYPH|nr:patatin-like phospholipase family protein [Pararhizobium capsulatum]MDQ0320068.1 NTE family protein [Pararhizobium capsulatum DSM 1112]